MSGNTKLTSAIVSAVVGCLTAFIVCFVFFYFFYKPAQPVDAQPPTAPTQSPVPSPVAEIPNPEIKAADVRWVGINTVFKGFFEAGNKCAKTYNEYFGNDDGVGSTSSPCTARITLDRDGHATRSVEIRRWDKAAREMRVIEKADSTAEITAAQFDSLVQTIVTNEAFRSWREGTEINVSNCSILVNHAGGTKSAMSNVDEKTIAFLPMVAAFRKMEKETAWKATK